MKSKSGTLNIKKEAILTLVLLVSIAVAAPVLIRQQLVTGTLVNATLILGACLLGARGGLIIGLLPSSVALALGLLSPALAPIIPFIIVGNAILVFTVTYLKNWNFWAAVVVGSILKFGFLMGTSTAVIGLLTSHQIASAAAQMMNWPQLATALMGGLAALGVFKIMKRYDLAN
jgi:hypothetical protein